MKTPIMIDYRKQLKEALGEKTALRPGYSMRAFAKQVEISPSHLSRVLRGEKDLSPKSALKIALELDFNHEKREQFLDLVSYHSADPHTKKLLLERINKRLKGNLKQSLDDELFKVISDWYYLPLFEFTKAKGFKSDSLWIAKKFNLSVAEINAAIDRMESLSLLTRDSHGNLSVRSELQIQTTDDITSMAIRKHHKQMSEKAIQALQTQMTEEREFQSVHFAFSPNNIKRAKKMIREFADKFESELKPLSGEEVYQLNLQFFRLTKKLNME